MKKTIAAILVTILASAGYVVLDKASADKIDLMASQISSQQAVINRLETATYPTETTSGSTEPSSWTMPTDPLEMWTGCTLRCYPDKNSHVQAYVFDISRATTNATTPVPTFGDPGSYYEQGFEYYYHEHTDVTINYYHCIMVGKTITGLPKFSVSLSGQVDSSFAGRQIKVWFGDSQTGLIRVTETIRSDGSFNVSANFTLANEAVISLAQIRID